MPRNILKYSTTTYVIRYNIEEMLHCLQHLFEDNMAINISLDNNVTLSNMNHL